jgi:hypothetical protein
MSTRIKALVWEECRVGGAIAGGCLLVALLLLLEFRYFGGYDAWWHDSALMLVILPGVPLLLAFLLILHPDFSGHLVGGFSLRILRLPVPTWQAVTVALSARTLFVFSATAALVGVSRLLFEGSPGTWVPFAITALYLCAQALDWLRTPVSGLTSVLLLAGAVLCIPFLQLVFGQEYGNAQSWLSFVRGENFNPNIFITTAVASVIAMAVAIPAVHAARVGKRVGIPEVWEWHKRLSLTMPARSRAFSTGLTAQVWSELRGTFWTIPATTFGISAVTTLGVVVFVNYSKSPQAPALTAGYTLFPGILIGAAVHGLLTRIIGFRKTSGRVGYAYLQPLTTAQFATARMVSNAAIVFPMVLAVIVLHLVIAERMFLFTLIPDAFALDLTSYREVARVFLHRAILLGLLAWPLAAVGTQSIRRAVVMLPAVGFGASMLLHVLGQRSIGYPAGYLLPCAGIACWTVWAYCKALRLQLIPIRSTLIAAVTWLVLGCYLYHLIVTANTGIEWLPMPYKQLEALVVAFGIAAVAPLPFVAVALDIQRHRHGGTPSQDPAQHPDASRTGVPRVGRTCIAGATALSIVLTLWLAWPAEPTYQTTWRAQGYPTTPEALNAWYPEVPETENVATEYVAISDAMGKRRNQYLRALAKEQNLNANHTDVRDLIGNVYPVMNKESVKRDQPIRESVWTESLAYNDAVVAETADALIARGVSDSTRSRYPIDLREGYSVNLPHLSKLRELSRALTLNTFRWTLAGDTQRAADAITAIVPIADSLEPEPVLVSQYVRIAILGTAARAGELWLNRSVPTEAELAQVQQALSKSLPDLDAPSTLMHALISETLISTEYRTFNHHTNMARGTLELMFGHSVDTLGMSLAFPEDAFRLIKAGWHHRILQESKKPLAARLGDDRTIWQAPYANLDKSLLGMMAAIHMGSGFSSRSEARAYMQLATAATAIALERYRHEHGELPDSLDALVPAYLPAVPTDVYRGADAPLSYRILEPDSFVVYSIGEDREDDQGVEMKHWNSVGDITFTVAPLAFRTGQHIVPDPPEVDEEVATDLTTQHERTVHGISGEERKRKRQEEQFEMRQRFRS